MALRVRAAMRTQAQHRARPPAPISVCRINAPPRPPAAASVLRARDACAPSYRTSHTLAKAAAALVSVRHINLAATLAKSPVGALAHPRPPHRHVTTAAGTSPKAGDGSTEPGAPKQTVYWRGRYALAAMMVRFDKRAKLVTIILMALFGVLIMVLYAVDNYYVGGVPVTAVTLSFYATEMERKSVAPVSQPSLKDALDLIQPYVFMFEVSAREPLHLMLLRTPLIGHVLARGALSSNLIIRSASLRTIANLIENPVAQELFLQNLHFDDIMDVKAWEVRLNQTFFPVLYRELPSLREGAETTSLSPEELRKLQAVFSGDWNVSSLVAISSILYHVSERHPERLVRTNALEFLRHFAPVHQNIETLCVRTYERMARKSHLLSEQQVRLIIDFLMKPSERVPWDAATKGRALTSLYRVHKHLLRTILGDQLGEALGPFKEYSSLYAFEQRFVPYFSRSLAVMALAAMWAAPRRALGSWARTEGVTFGKIGSAMAKAAAGSFALDSLALIADKGTEALRSWNNPKFVSLTNNAVFFADLAFIPATLGAAYAISRRLPYSFLPWLAAEAVNVFPAPLQGHSSVMMRTLLKWQDPRTLEPIEYDRALYQAAMQETDESDPALSRKPKRNFAKDAQVPPAPSRGGRPDTPWNIDRPDAEDNNPGMTAFRHQLNRAQEMDDEDDDDESPWERPAPPAPQPAPAKRRQQ